MPKGGVRIYQPDHGCFWLGDSWTDSSASESEAQAAALLVDLPPVKSPVSVKKLLSKLLHRLGESGCCTTWLYESVKT